MGRTEIHKLETDQRTFKHLLPIQFQKPIHTYGEYDESGIWKPFEKEKKTFDEFLVLLLKYKIKSLYENIELHPTTVKLKNIKSNILRANGSSNLKKKFNDLLQHCQEKQCVSNYGLDSVNQFEKQKKYLLALNQQLKKEIDELTKHEKMKKKK